MNTNNLVKISKKAGEYFTVATGVGSIIVTIIATFITVPMVIAWPIIIVVGLIFACLGASKAYYDIKQRIQRREKKSLALDNLQEIKIELDEIREELACAKEHVHEQDQPVAISGNTAAFFAKNVTQDKEFKPEQEIKAEQVASVRNAMN